MESKRVKSTAGRALFFSLLLFGALAALTTQASAQGGVPLWTNYYNGPGNGDDEAYAMVVDGSGNVIVTGQSLGSGDFLDFATVKYSNDGMPLWTNRYNGPGNSNDIAAAVAVDNSGGVFVTGYSYGTNGTTDYATVAYSSAGLPLWTNRYHGLGIGDNLSSAVVVDGSSNVFVSGFSDGGESGWDYAVVAYLTSGVAFWTNRYNGTANIEDFAHAVAISKGNVIVTGGSFNLFTGRDYATVAYSSTGIPIWTNRFNGAINLYDEAWGIAVDNSGNVFVTGTSYKPGYSDYDFDYATVGYSTTGIPLWTNRYDGPVNGDDEGWNLAVDKNGNVFVTGWSEGDGTSVDFATVAYSNSGVPLWTNRYNGPANGEDYAYSIAVDNIGNVFVTGRSQGNGSSYDYVTIKYSSSIPPVYLNSQLLNNELVLSWTNGGFSLQTAPASTGTFTNLPGATSPYTNSPSAAQQFFRLKKD